ncbi:MAG: LPS export ABC transporter periplasmic protein LptC [Bacteroidales bacterium]|nr:LPS export ABC transporter periplasmic protein LptC [Bacteroidales bacterium]
MIFLKKIIQPAFITKWVVIFVFSTIFGCKTDLSKIKPPEDIDNLPQLSITNFHAFYKISSELKAEAFAPIMHKYNIGKNYVEFTEGLDVKFYDENFNPTTTLFCEYAINYPDEELWKFSENVEVVSENGGILKTQELFFNQKNEKIYSVKYVEVTDTTGSVIRGKGGFESNYDFTVYEFKNVDGIINIPQESIDDADADL